MSDSQHLLGCSPPPLPPPAPPPGPHRGGVILTLGLLGLFGLLPLGAAAWAMANRDLDRMDDGLVDRAGEGLTRAGKVLAAVGLIGACTVLGAVFLMMVAFASTLGGL